MQVVLRNPQKQGAYYNPNGGHPAKSMRPRQG